MLSVRCFLFFLDYLKKAKETSFSREVFIYEKKEFSHYY